MNIAIKGIEFTNTVNQEAIIAIRLSEHPWSVNGYGWNVKVRQEPEGEPTVELPADLVRFADSQTQAEITRVVLATYQYETENRTRRDLMAAPPVAWAN